MPSPYPRAPVVPWESRRWAGLSVVAMARPARAHARAGLDHRNTIVGRSRLQVFGQDDGAMHLPGTLNHHRVAQGDLPPSLQVDRFEHIPPRGRVDRPGGEAFHDQAQVGLGRTIQILYVRRL